MSFYDIRIPQEDRPALDQLVNNLKHFASDHKTSGYFGDNLITLGRNLGFMADKRFLNAVNNSFLENGDVNKTWRLHVYSWAIKTALPLDGDLIECGVYRGLYVDSAIKYLGETAFENKEFYLYDTFEGLDLRYSTTMEMALSLDAEGIAEYSKNDNETGVRNRFEKFKWVKVVKGVVPDILKISSPKKISFLHLDLNAGEAETKALDYLYDRVTNGGVILIDDYGRFEHNQLHCAHNQWFLNKGQSILELPTGQGLVIKRK